MIEFAVFAQLKDEEYFLETWIDHYFKLGFQHLFLLDDQSLTPVRKYLENNKYISNITIFDIDFSYQDWQNDNIKNSNLYHKEIYEATKMTTKQHYLLNFFFFFLRDKVKWLLTCDLDEFLNLKTFKTIQEFVGYYQTKKSDISGFVFPWVSFGSNWHSFVPKGHIFENFLYCEKFIDVHGYGKPLTLLEKVQFYEIHFPFIQSGKLYHPYKFEF